MEEILARISSAVMALELATERLSERETVLFAQADERVEHIVATVESQRETELAQRLEAAEAKLVAAENTIAELTASAAKAVAQGRKTAQTGMVATLAKQGISASALEGVEGGRIEAGTLDAALGSLSIEQRFAVKAELLRTGLLG